ncbi:MAG TPA: hypothetical protein VN030_05575 [Cellvibrio sp.]|nr:hypothetical protein [Cellvibrio sp.]
MNIKGVMFAFVIALTGCFALMFSQMVKADIPRAYELIADHYGLPREVFFSIAMVESGKLEIGKNRDRRFLPWPWTLNIDKKPYYFDTREEAEAALMQALVKAEKEGRIGKVAVGLGQIYMPAHINQFVSPLQALDPSINLNYAAKLLVEHYIWTIKRGKPDWWIAVGRYHSPGNENAAKNYRELVYSRCARVSSRCSSLGDSVVQQLSMLAQGQ